MEIKWVLNAKNSLEDTLNYWDNRNGTPSYSNKIIAELKKLLSKISNDPYSERYEKDLGIYVGGILKRRFLIYYVVREEENIIEIQYFRSSYQQPLADYLREKNS